MDYPYHVQDYFSTRKCTEWSFFRLEAQCQTWCTNQAEDPPHLEPHRNSKSGAHRLQNPQDQKKPYKKRNGASASLKCLLSCCLALKCATLLPIRQGGSQSWQHCHITPCWMEGWAGPSLAGKRSLAHAILAWHQVPGWHTERTPWCLARQFLCSAASTSPNLLGGFGWLAMTVPDSYERMTKWLLQMWVMNQNLYRKWLEITKHPWYV